MDHEISSERMVVDWLKRLIPGKLPYEIFLQIARLSVSAIVELVPLMGTSSGVQVLLTRRPDDDRYWPGMLHTPGTVIRPDDVSYEYALQRILTDELFGVEIIGAPVFCKNILHRVARGTESAAIYYVELTSRPSLGSMHDVDHLPDNVIDTQLEMIKWTAEWFSSRGNSATS
jgi:hypothetical protein